MKQRNLVLQAAVGTALVAMFGVANATSIGRSAPAAAIAAYAGSYTIAAESTQANYAVNLNSAVATGNGVATPPSGTIRWVPTFGLNTGDVCTFTFTNARYMSADAKLLGEEAATQQPTTGAVSINGDADTTDVVEVASNFGSLDAVNGVTSIQVRINNGLTLPTGINLVLAQNAGVDANTDGVLDDETMNVLLRIPAGTGPSNVTIASACTTAGGLAIGAANASNSILDLENQFAMTLLRGATSVTDVGATPPRTMFVEEGAADDVLTTTNDTDLQRSAGTYTFNNDADGTVEDFYALTAADLLIFTLTSSSDLTGVSATAANNYVEADAAGAETTDDTNFNFTLTSPTMTSAAIPGTNLPARGAAMSDDMVIAIDGTTIIADRTFTGSAFLNFTAATRRDTTFTLGTTHTWTTNGTVLQAPWFSTAAGYISRFILTNTGTGPAPFSVQIITETGNTCTAGTGAGGGTIPANGVFVVDASSLCSAFVGFNRAAAIFTINAPKSNIHGVFNIVNPSTGSVSVETMVTNNGTNADH